MCIRDSHNRGVVLDGATHAYGSLADAKFVLVHERSFYIPESMGPKMTDIATSNIDRLGNVSVAHQASPTQWLEVSFQPTGHGIGLDGEGAELAAETIVWLMQTAHMPAEAEAVLIEWASDLIPLDLTTTRESLLAAVSYTHLRAHETKANLVCRLLLEKKKKNKTKPIHIKIKNKKKKKKNNTSKKK